MRDLNALHEEYLGCVKRFLSDAYGGDRGITVTEAEYMVRMLQERPPKLILEMGTGFSSLVLRELAPQIGMTVFSAEHDPMWLGFVRGIISTRPELDQRHFYTVAQVKARVRRRSSRFDVVFVDHGPSWKARLEDLAWCARVLSPGGELWLDDWYPKDTRPYRMYTRPAREALEKMGVKLMVPPDSRREGDRKSLCVGRVA